MQEYNLKENDVFVGEIRVKDKINDTLEHLAESGKSFWRLAQSRKGTSYEKCYAEYKEGEITTSDNGLSFVSEDNIAACYMYGDVLVELDFDMNNDKFRKISNSNYVKTGGSFIEYRTTNLLVKKIYSLEKLETIRLLFEKASTLLQIQGLISGYNILKGEANFESRLRKMEFYESANLIRVIRNKYDNRYQEYLDHFDDFYKEILDFIDNEIKKKNI
ncbi:hypothetical protein [Eubacterium sp. Marseille-QA0814]|uniref:hypothetical protein n=1 Tax=Eubacterium sp. Marseille-QA0814 TaxID=3378778 RepID=UPI003D0BC5C2